MNKQRVTSAKLGDDNAEWLDQEAEANGVSVTEILCRCVERVRTEKELPRPIVLQNQCGESFSAEVTKLSKTAWELRKLVRDFKATAVTQSDSDLRTACYSMLNSLLPICHELSRLSKLAGCIDEDTLDGVYYVSQLIAHKIERAKKESDRAWLSAMQKAIFCIFGELKKRYVVRE